jgi:hypothetical protein
VLAFATGLVLAPVLVALVLATWPTLARALSDFAHAVAEAIRTPSSGMNATLRGMVSLPWWTPTLQYGARCGTATNGL